MRITKKLIAQTCLPIYKELLEKGKKDNKVKFLNRLRTRNAEHGICGVYYSLPNSVGNIYHFIPIRRICKVDRFGRKDYFPSWYYKIPRVCDTKKEMVECIQKRIDLLEKWL